MTKAAYQQSKLYLWTLSIFLVAVLLVFRAADTLHVGRLNTEYTAFPDPANAATNGVIFSQRYRTFNYWATSLLGLLWLIPFSAMLMLAFITYKRTDLATWYFHLVVLVLLLVVTTALVIYYIVLWARANVAPSDPRYVEGNIANDARWCCVAANRDGAALTSTCPNKDPGTTCGAIVGGLTLADLVVNPDFLFRFWFLVGIWALAIVDLVLTVWLTSSLPQPTTTTTTKDEKDEKVFIVRQRV